MTPSTPRQLAKFSLVAIALSAAFSPVSAQEAVSEDSMLIEKIEVTARKRSESLQEVPIAVSAMTSESIDKQGIISVGDLQNFTPGLVISNNYSGKADRSVQTFTLRGFTPSNGNEATASMFIDGVPVSSTTAISSIGSPERVEILRGPQAAYFGRNTFAGAVNIVNKTPNEEWAGSVDLTVGNYDYSRLRGEIEGVIVDDKLSFRATAETYEREGARDNSYSDGGTLGDQKTTMANLYLYATPTDDLTLKAFGFYSRDEDGPSASALISAYSLDEYNLTGQSNCTMNGNPYFCSVPQKADPLAYNTAASDSLQALLSNPENRLSSTSLLDGYGLGREFYHAHLVADWDVTDTITLSSLTGYNNEEWIGVNDIDHFASDSYFYTYVVDKKNEDVSQEFRLSYAGDGKLNGSVGVSYLDASKQSATAGVVAGYTPASINPPSETKAETMGVFFGLTYDLSDDTTLSMEGRYQTDELSSLDNTGTELANEKFTNFMPRVIVDHKLSDDTMAYVSYSKGVNPGSFNSYITGYSAYIQEQLAAEGVGFVVQPETVNNYEVGLKGSLIDGSMNYALAAYYAQWNDQINQAGYVFQEDSDAQAENVAVSVNAGDVDLYGIEFESYWMVTSDLRVNASAAYIGSDINSFKSNNLTTLTGISDFSGKEQPGVSKYSGNIGLQYNGVVANEHEYFLRGDYIYKSGMWSNAANIVKTEAIHKVNLRAGVYIGDLELQAYADNVFDNDEYTFAFDYYTFSPTYQYTGVQSAMLMSLQQPRTFGLRAKYSFY
ncbi:TonB-dependent receptor [Alteromonas sp. NFXS44]|uniref:TonB-dependent receptor n=1 Tax=Alteromonas sp. NFXS44 TaxID=2818435 RepID=UPI0032DE3764